MHRYTPTWTHADKPRHKQMQKDTHYTDIQTHTRAQGHTHRYTHPQLWLSPFCFSPHPGCSPTLSQKLPQPGSKPQGPSPDAQPFPSPLCPCSPPVPWSLVALRPHPHSGLRAPAAFASAKAVDPLSYSSHSLPPSSPRSWEDPWKPMDLPEICNPNLMPRPVLQAFPAPLHQTQEL